MTHQLATRHLSLTLAILFVAWGVSSARAQDDCPAQEFWAGDAQTYAVFGQCFALAPALAAVPSPSTNTVTVYTRAADGWSQDALITAPWLEVQESFPWTSVSVDGLHLAVGSYDENRSGPAQASSSHVFVYQRESTGWSLQATLSPSDRSDAYHDAFGTSVAMEGDRIVVGSESLGNDTGDPHGAVYVYDKIRGAWTETARLSPPELTQRWSFARGVALTGDRVFVGEHFATDPDCPPTVDCHQSGLVHVYSLEDEGWLHEATLSPSDATRSAYFGISLDADGDRLIVGAQGARTERTDPDTVSGAAYVFRRMADGSWFEEGKLQPSSLDFAAGSSVAIDGAWAAVNRGGVGVPFHTVWAGIPGYVHLFSLEAGAWVEQDVLEEGSDGEAYGYWVDLAGGALFAGAPATSFSSGVVHAHDCPSMMSAEDRGLLEEPSPIDRRVAPPLDLRLTGNFLVLGWEETMDDPNYRLQLGTLLSLWRDRTYDHAPYGPCELPDPGTEVELPEGNSYFLVVSVDKDDGTESSYGRDSSGEERPSSGVDCP